MKVEDLLKTLIERNGSDLHLMVGLPPVLRIDGKLSPLGEYGALSMESAQHLICAVLTEEQKDIFEKDRDRRYELDFAYGVSGLG
jgi:twitching motility protein PilT